MRVVWQHDVVTAEQVGQDLERPLKDSTIRTVPRRLEEKGYVEPNSSFREAKEPFASPGILQFILFMIHQKPIPPVSFSEEARESVDRSGCCRAAGQPAGS
jgi:hypothetical protein